MSSDLILLEGKVKERAGARGKPYIIRVLESECEISLVAHYFKSGYGFTPRK